MFVFASGAGLNPLHVNPGLIIWTLVTFTIVLIVLWKAAWGPISKALDERKEKIESSIADAERERAAAEELLRKRQAEFNKQVAEAQAIIAEGKRDALALREDILQKARTEADELRKRTLHEIELAKQKAVDEVRGHIVTASIDIASKVLGQKLDAKAHREFIERAVSEYNTIN